MTIKKFHPFRDLVSMQEEMNKLFSDFFRRSPEYSETFGEGLWNPTVDIKETKTGFELRAEVPGVSKDDIEITLHDDILTIKGEKKDEFKEESDTCLLIERSYGKFQRSFRLPTEVDSSKVKAEFKDGVLHLVLPKSEKAKPKEIKIDVE